MCQEEVNTDGFAYLDIALPYVAWSAYRGILITPPSAQVRGGRFVSWWLCNLLRNPGRIELEMALERVREQRFPERISRLVGLFCFLDKTCAARAVCWGGHFRAENLAELSFSEATGCNPLDANWITYADHRAKSPNEEWMSRYWQGQPCPDAEPVWEILVEGKVAVLRIDIRERAYQVVNACWPDSLMLLEISRLGAWIGSDIGSIDVFMADNIEGNHEFKFMLDMRDANDTGFLERLTQLMASDHPVNRAAIGPHYEQGTFGRTPDMTPYQFSCPKLN